MRPLTLNLCRENDVKNGIFRLEEKNATLKRITVRICLPYLNGEITEDTSSIWERIASIPVLKDLSIHLNGKEATPVPIQNLVDALTGLLVCGSKIVSMRINTIWMEGSIQPFVKAIEQFPCLKSLHLWQTQVAQQEEGLEPLFALTSFLEEFKLEPCGIYRFSPASPDAMAAITKSKVLKTLTLDKLQDAEISAFLEALYQSETNNLKELDFGDSKLQLSAVQSLSRILRKHSSLESLRICIRENVPIDPLTDSLKSNTSLKRMCFCRSQETSSTISLQQDINNFLAVLVEQNFTLEEIEVSLESKSYLEPVVDTEIEFYLQLNRSNRSEILSYVAANHEASMDPQYWIDVLSSSEYNSDASCLYYWLYKNPWICRGI